MADALTMWTIYDHPSDFPDGYIARRWEVTAGVTAATSDTLVNSDLEPLREEMLARGLHRLHRDTNDDPTIVETWL